MDGTVEFRSRQLPAQTLSSTYLLPRPYSFAQKEDPSDTRWKLEEAFRLS